jgi:hypothetical protein
VAAVGKRPQPQERYGRSCHTRRVRRRRQPALQPTPVRSHHWAEAGGSPQDDHAADAAEPLAIRHSDGDPLLGARGPQPQPEGIRRGHQDPSVPVETVSSTEAHHYEVRSSRSRSPGGDQGKGRGINAFFPDLAPYDLAPAVPIRHGPLCCFCGANLTLMSLHRRCQPDYVLASPVPPWHGLLATEAPA